MSLRGLVPAASCERTKRAAGVQIAQAKREKEQLELISIINCVTRYPPLSFSLCTDTIRQAQRKNLSVHRGDKKNLHLSEWQGTGHYLRKAHGSKILSSNLIIHVAWSCQNQMIDSGGLKSLYRNYSSPFSRVQFLYEFGEKGRTQIHFKSGKANIIYWCAVTGN